MTLRAPLPPPGSYRNTFEKEFQYLQSSNLCNTSTPDLEREEQLLCMSQIVNGTRTREAVFFKAATHNFNKIRSVSLLTLNECALAS